MKKAVSWFLIVLLWSGTNCATLHRRPQYQGSLNSCYIKCIKGSIELFRGKAGHLVFYDKVMKFHWKTYSLDIPFENITRCQAERTLKKMQLRDPTPYPRHHTPEGLLPGFWESLLGVGILLAVLAVGIALLWLSEDYMFLSIEFNVDGQGQWVLFKCVKSEFDRILPILEDKVKNW